jgi:hypothetical protein
MLAAVLLFGGVLMIAPVFGAGLRPEGCSQALLDLGCTRIELTVQVPGGHTPAEPVLQRHG